MAPVASKEEVEDQEKERHRKLAQKICFSSFLSVCQHFVVVQTEPQLYVHLCEQNRADAARMLGNTSGMVGVLSLLFNQFGGKLSDSIGRRKGFLVGPLANVFLGLLVFKNPRNRPLVTLCRVLRLILTTFSNTVMCQAALSDFCSGSDLAVASSRIQAATGLALLAVPRIEARALKSAPGLDGVRSVYAVLSVMGAIHAGFVWSQIEETLSAAKRKALELTPKTILEMINPLGFVRIFTEGSTALKKLVVMTTLQMTLEGKNLSDMITNYTRDHLKWTVDQFSYWAMYYGSVCSLSGMFLIPRMLKALPPRRFTTLTNLLNTFAFTFRGVVPSTLLWLAFVPFMLPGVNGSSAIPLRVVATDMATQQKFGKGEFSAWVNNLRALAGSISPVIYAQVYAALEEGGRLNPGLFLAVAGLIGAAAPQAMLSTMPDSELSAAGASGS